MNRNSCPLLMDALNIKTESHNIRHAIFPIRFDCSEITRKLDGEKFHHIEYENFPLIQEARKIYKLKIRSGMYQHADALFKEFKYIVLRELVDSKVEMSVPLHTKVTFREKLSNMLGFRMNTFTKGNYASDYILELRAGITEVYVYCDIIAPSLVGDVSASILKIIPIANGYKEQIAKQFTVPLYFPIRKNYFDTIEIELVTSSGPPIKFISGKKTLSCRFEGQLHKTTYKEFLLLYSKLSAMEKRGQRLDPNDCIGYYCKQQIGSGSYFASNYPIQRGYGLFSNLRRYAMPIMMKAGKYLGKHLLSTGQNVLEDMSQGKSFKEASKYQLRQVGEEIKKDILRKLKGGGDVKRKKQSSRRQTKRKKSCEKDVFTDL
ncbi:uncharacterized protein TNCV_1290071 [Trichonephila clavipes]|nr:uncharacterized protein TNCV_1290071 [Trichonephila clavipes]